MCVNEREAERKKEMTVGQRRNFSVVRLHCSVIVEEEEHGT